MKKLLALVLCVVMVMSLAPAAFAGGYAVDDPLYSVAGYKKQIENMIKHTRENVEGAYKALVGDKVVYTSAKAMDDTVVELVDAIANPLIEKGKANKAWADGVKNAIRHYLDETVADKIADDYYKCLDKDGNVDDLKYAQLIANSINKALTDKKFVAGYQAVATYFALGQVVSDIKDNLKDEYEAFQDSIDPKFQARFAAQYTNLVDDYIDTLGTATAKIFTADLAAVLYAEAVADAEDDYDAAVDKADTAYENAVGALRDKYEATATTAQIKRDYDEEMAEVWQETQGAKVDAAYEGMLEKADSDYEDAMDKAAKITDPYTRAQKEAEAKAQYKTDIASAKSYLATAENNLAIDYKRDMKNAKDTYDTTVKADKEAYEAADKAATKTYDKAVDAAQAAYDKAVAEAAAEYGPDMVYEINPWAEVVYPTVGSPW